MAGSCRRRLTAVVLAGVVVVAGVSCSSDDPSAGEADATAPAPAASDDATATAVGVCGVLVEFVDLVAEEVNAASREIRADTDPDVARELLLGATDDIQAAVDTLPERYEATRVSDEGDLAQISDDSAANTADVDAQLGDIAAELSDGLDDEDARANLSAVFIDMEKILSLAQPNQGDYSDAALVAALDSVPDCEHTISR